MYDSSPRVSGSVFEKQRQAGTVWYAKWRVDGHQKKQRIGPVWTERGRPRDGHLTRKMAEAWLEAKLTDERRGALLSPTGNTRTVKGAADEWLAYVEHDKGRAATTVGDYRRTVVNHMLPHFGESTPVSKITPDHVEAYRSRVLATMKRPSAHKALVLLNGLCKYALRKRWIAVNPCDAVERIGVKRSGEFNVLSVEEVHAVVRAADTPQDAAIFAVAAFAGLRMGELRALRWRDVDFTNRLIHVQRNYTHRRLGLPKSGKVRSVPLIDQAAKSLDAISRRELFTEPDDLVFCTLLGSWLNEGELRRRFYTALAGAGLGDRRKTERPMVFHDLRHSFGTLAVQVWDLPRVQTYMGHADISTTMGYVHHVPRHSDADALTRLVAVTDELAHVRSSESADARTR